ncbi:DUF5606 domain-containing protein [Phocaeicola sartorii]|uniref:DUF5606 family protein n=1 Tax=Phocaeicola sartorii TaxID=671267 RepID=UPI002590A626|nr:DUF5606 domain-containing protein [Phocaeicola sartorii]
MLETILAISGKPGLYRLVSRGNRSLIVETLDEVKKRMPAFAADKVISLADIAMYTDDGEVPLQEVLVALKKKEDGQLSTFDYKKASHEDLAEYFSAVLPNYDRDRVYPSDIKKLISWYNLLVKAGITDFDKVLTPTEGENIADREVKE